MKERRKRWKEKRKAEKSWTKERIRGETKTEKRRNRKEKEKLKGFGWRNVRDEGKRRGEGNVERQREI